MKKLIILRGIPGSGKTTHAHELMQYYIKENKNVAHFEADMFSQSQMAHTIGSLIWLV